MESGDLANGAKAEAGRGTLSAEESAEKWQQSSTPSTYIQLRRQRRRPPSQRRHLGEGQLHRVQLSGKKTFFIFIFLGVDFTYPLVEYRRVDLFGVRCCSALRATIRWRWTASAVLCVT